MDIKTFEDLIEWTRQLHGHLKRCLKASAKLHGDERAAALLDYLSEHEGLLALEKHEAMRLARQITRMDDL